MSELRRATQSLGVRSALVLAGVGYAFGLCLSCTATSLPLTAHSGVTAEAPGEELAPPGTEAQERETQKRVVSGPLPPDFELETLDGQTLRLSEQLGDHVVLIDFWATYCDPCLQAMPHLAALYEQHKSDGLLVLGVSIDGPESVAQVRTEVAKLGVTFPILLDDESTAVALYNPKTSAPYSVLIGRNGAIISHHEGYTSSGAARLEEEILAALKEGK